MLKKIFALFAVVLLLGVTVMTALACNNTKNKTDDDLLKYGPNYRKELETADQQYLYGMCHGAYSDYAWRGIDYVKGMQLIKNMGAKSVRFWMHCNWLMSDPDTFIEGRIELFKDMIQKLQSHGFQIIAMNHSNFHKSGLPNSDSSVAKPSRDLSEGSYYLQWLEDYERTWYNMVKEFPEITYWEIDNESNIDTFFKKLEGGTFTLKQRAEIYTDMLFYASRGIHRANPNAITVLGGLVSSSAVQFLEYIYENIKAPDSWSPYPDDYFQVAAWHPYMNDFTVDKFVRVNQEIYDVIVRNEGKNKKVFFTELGWSEHNVKADVIEEFIEQAYQATKEHLKFVESIHYFTLTDHLGSSWSTVQEKYFGMFYDPNPKQADLQWAQENFVKGGPKPYAYKYQELAGGQGPLDLFQK
ncbi:MAG TPA: hypothetical protein VIL24_02795 [Clostridia bacterium]